MNDIIKIIKSLEDLGVLIDGVCETVKLWALLVPLVISSAVKGISGRGVRRAGRGHMNKIF